MNETRLSLVMVDDMPNEISSGILYVSEEYEIACHRCVCGCDNLVYTPLGPTEWRFYNEGGKASLKPSIGNWALPCRSHYWISAGRVLWASNWSNEQVRSGREAEVRLRDQYYEQKSAPEREQGIVVLIKRLWKLLFRK
jgi:Family of unknown function (DUF6527)